MKLAVLAIVSCAGGATCSGQTTYARFARPTDTIKINGNTILNQGEFTYEMRVWLDGPFGIVIKEQRDSLEDKAVFLGDQQFLCSVVGSGESGDFRGTPAALTVGEWHHVAWVRCGDEVTLYVDGQSRFSVANYAVYGDPSDSRMAIGLLKEEAALGPTPGCVGKLDWIRISAAAKYCGAFAPPVESSITTDPSTQLLLRFNEPEGTATLIDESPNHFVCEPGGVHQSGYSATAPQLGQTDCAIPSIDTQPTGGAFFAGDQVVLAVAVRSDIGVTYRWRKDGVNLFNSGVYSGVTSPTLRIATTDPSQSGGYAVAITNACGTTTSDAAMVTVACSADFNGDEFVDFFDYDAFVTAFEAGEPSADQTRDGFLDFFDYDGFVVAFENGC